MTKPEFKVSDLSIVFPAGAGGNFLISTCYDTKYSMYDRKFNEFKMYFPKILTEIPEQNLGWFVLDDKFAEIGNESAVNTAESVNRVSANICKFACGHHLPVNTQFHYKFSTTRMLEIIAASNHSCNIIRMLAKAKNDLFTDFNKKQYQLVHLLTSTLDYVNKSKFSITEILQRFEALELFHYVDNLGRKVDSIDKHDNILYTKNSILMWKYVMRCIIRQEEISVDGFNDFLYNQFNLLLDNVEHDLALRKTMQESSRAFFRENFNFISLDYCSLFFDLYLPDMLLQCIDATRSESIYEIFARYSKRNLEICDQVIDAIHNTEYSNTVDFCRTRLKLACERLSINYEAL